jgi:hypothetical protein
MGKWGDQSGAALPYLMTGVSLKAAPAASIHATKHKLHRLRATRSVGKELTGISCPNLLKSTLFY